MFASQDEVLHVTDYVVKFTSLFIHAFSLKIFGRLQGKTNTNNHKFLLKSAKYIQSVREDVRFEVTHLYSTVSNEV